MGLDISKIANESLKKLAESIDKRNDKDGKLSEAEILIFQAQAKDIKGVSQKDIDAAISLFNNVEYKSEPSVDAFSKKTVNKAALKNLEDAVKSKDIKSMEDVIEDITAHNESPEFIQAVKDVQEAMSKDYTSSRDVNKDHSEVIKKLKEQGKNDSLHKEILELLEDQAKKEVSYAAFEEIGKRYQEKAKESPEATDQQIMNAVKKELDGNKDLKKAWKAYAKSTIMEKARARWRDLVLSNTDETRTRKLKHAAKNQAKDNNYEWQNNKYLRKAAHGQSFGEMISGEETEGTMIARTTANRNRVHQSVVQSKAQIDKEISSENMQEIFKSLVDSGIVKELKDGNYDLTNLSEMIGLYAGGDYTLETQRNRYKVLGEKLNLRNHLIKESDIERLTERQAKKLAKLCGYEYDGIDVKRALLHTLLGFAAGAASGAGAAALNPKQRTIINKEGSHFRVEVNANLGDVESIKDQLINSGISADEVNITNTAAGIIIDITTKGKYLEVVASKLISSTALTAGLINAAIALASSLGPEGEKPIAPVTDFRAETLDDYIEELGDNKYSQVLSAAALLFTDEAGKWHKDEYRQWLEKTAGVGSVLSKDEIIAGLEELKNHPPVFETEKPEEVKEVIVTEPEDKTYQKGVTVTKEEAQELSVHYERKPGDTWSGIINTYYPDVEPNHTVREAIRKLKTMLGVDPLANDLPKEANLPSQLFDDVKVAKSGDDSNRGIGFQKAPEGTQRKEAVANREAEYSDESYTATEVQKPSNTSTSRVESDAVDTVVEKMGEKDGDTKVNIDYQYDNKQSEERIVKKQDK